MMKVEAEIIMYLWDLLNLWEIFFPNNEANNEKNIFLCCDNCIVHFILCL
jgi:hypothetical protein